MTHEDLVELHCHIDRLLMEQGEYQPLELLLRQCRLTYADYEAWRNQHTDLLDEALFGDIAHIKTQLKLAEDYVQQLGLVRHSLEIHAWRNDNHALLRFSSDAEFNRLFHGLFRKDDTDPQLDLFLDSAATILVNAIMQSLVNRQPGQARRQWHQLFNQAPDHVRLGGLERLIEASEYLQGSVHDPAGECRWLHEEIAPLADDILGKDSRNLMVPLWRHLGDALCDRRFDPDQPRVHTSFTAAQALEWEAVYKAVVSEPGWHQQPVLIKRCFAACHRLRWLREKLMAVFLLCWCCPTDWESAILEDDPVLARDWHAFEALEPELALEYFPTWLLLKKPELEKLMSEGVNPQVVYPTHYVLVMELQQQVSMQRKISTRKHIKNKYPDLFLHYMQHIKKMENG